MPHPQWLEFLNTQGVTTDDNDAQPVATECTQKGTLLIPLTRHTLISMEGPDAKKFLQGQLTCDLSQLSAEQSLLGANCSHKGMVISVLRLFQHTEDALLLRLPLAVAEPALANLKKFAVFSKVDITPVDQQWVGLGLIGESAPELLSKLGISAPERINEQVLSGNLTLVRVPGTTPRFELWCPATEAAPLWQRLQTECDHGNPQAWLAADIEAGLVELDPDSLENYIPQMLNLQAVDAIGFKKGCYIGQEVIARLQFRGKLKKLLYAATLEASHPDSLTAATGSLLVNSSGRNIGKVLNVVRQRQQLLIQAIISKSAADEGSIYLQSPEGAAITLLPLPYSIDPQLFERPEH